MTCGRISILCAGVLLAVGAGAAGAQDWPEWCGRASRNMAARSDQSSPDSADCGQENDDGEVDLASTKNVKWVARLGHRNTGSPVVGICFDKKDVIGQGRSMRKEPDAAENESEPDEAPNHGLHADG